MQLMKKMELKLNREDRKEYSHLMKNLNKRTASLWAWLGFAPTLSDIREIVTDYININKKEKAQKTFHYKNLKESPGKDWIYLLIYETAESKLKKMLQNYKTMPQCNQKPIHYQSLV